METRCANPTGARRVIKYISQQENQFLDFQVLVCVGHFGQVFVEIDQVSLQGASVYDLFDLKILERPDFGSRYYPFGSIARRCSQYIVVKSSIPVIH